MLKSLKKLKKAENYDIAAERPSGELHVTMSNALASAAHALSLSEKRVMMLCVAKLDSRRTPDPGKPPTVTISATEYAENYGVDPNTAYEQLKGAGDHLFKRQIGFQQQGRKGPVIVRMRWIGSARYHEGEGSVTLAFWHEVVPFLMGLRKQFTSYKLAQASSLRSTYSWRLLELLSQFQGTGWREMEVEEFAHAMEAPPAYRANFKDLRVSVIEPAVKELVEKDGWKIEWKPLKRGRRVAGLRFEFERDPQGRLPFGQ